MASLDIKRDLVGTQDDLQSTKTSLGSVNVQKKFRKTLESQEPLNLKAFNGGQKLR